MKKTEANPSLKIRNKGSWTAEEDRKLEHYVKIHGDKKWKSLPAKAGLNRCGKSCRLRWLNYLRPGIKRGNISEEEEDLIIRLHNLLGNRWSLIAGRLPGRTDNEIKNHWNTHLSKKSLTINQLNCKLNEKVEIASDSSSTFPTSGSIPPGLRDVNWLDILKSKQVDGTLMEYSNPAGEFITNGDNVDKGFFDLSSASGLLGSNPNGSSEFGAEEMRGLQGSKGGCSEGRSGYNEVDLERLTRLLEFGDEDHAIISLF